MSAETNRDRVASLVGDAGQRVLVRAMGETGLCCARGAPLCKPCREVVAELRASLAEVVAGIPQEAIDRLATAPEEELVKVVLEMIEPSFRKSIAKDLPS